jgi:ubiquinone/menaquinone biosynthesis C-methylase UbiE
MTWEEAVDFLRQSPKNNKLIRDTYLLKDLKVNVDNYRNSEEYKIILSMLRPLFNKFDGIRVVDIGAGNGILAINLALDGFQVTALEPDPSEWVGSGAIKKLKEAYQLNNLEINMAFGESLPLKSNSQKVVFCRQVLHHAHNLDKFVAETYRVLKAGGYIITLRDHVVSSEYQKKQFLNTHPLHKYYGGENAFRLEEYKVAFSRAGFNLVQIFKPSDSPLNYEPWSMKELRRRLGVFSYIPLLPNLSWRILMFRLNRMPGRLYSFVAKKN